MERFNGTMKMSLSQVLQPEEENLWNMALRRVDFAYNVSVHCSMLLSPFQMLFGYHPEYPLDIIIDPQTFLEGDEVEKLSSPRNIEKTYFKTSRTKFQEIESSYMNPVKKKYVL